MDISVNILVYELQLRRLKLNKVSIEDVLVELACFVSIDEWIKENEWKVTKW